MAVVTAMGDALSDPCSSAAQASSWQPVHSPWALPGQTGRAGHLSHALRLGAIHGKRCCARAVTVALRWSVRRFAVQQVIQCASYVKPWATCRASMLQVPSGNTLNAAANDGAAVVPSGPADPRGWRGWRAAAAQPVQILASGSPLAWPRLLAAVNVTHRAHRAGRARPAPSGLRQATASACPAPPGERFLRAGRRAADRPEENRN